MKPIDLNFALKVYELITEKYDENSNEYNKLVNSISEKLNNEDSIMFESVKSDYKKCSDNAIVYFQHIIKIICQPWMCHSSFYDSLYKTKLYTDKLLKSTNVYNLINDNIENIVDKGYKNALKEMNSDKRAIENSKLILKMIDFYDIEILLYDSKKLREFIIDSFNKLDDLSYSDKANAMELYDRYFKE